MRPRPEPVLAVLILIQAAAMISSAVDGRWWWFALYSLFQFVNVMLLLDYRRKRR